jgi:hypothetical protein
MTKKYFFAKKSLDKKHSIVQYVAFRLVKKCSKKLLAENHEKICKKLKIRIVFGHIFLEKFLKSSSTNFESEILC